MGLERHLDCKRAERKLAAILADNVAGCSRLVGADEAKASSPARDPCYREPLEASEQDIEFAAGKFTVSGTIAA